MTIDNIANWAFAYVLVGAVIWALLFAGGIMDRAFAESRAGGVLASIGAIFGWPILALVFFHGMWCGARQRRVRS